jgi:hypothetical protein
VVGGGREELGGTGGVEIEGDNDGEQLIDIDGATGEGDGVVGVVIVGGGEVIGEAEVGGIVGDEVETA